MNIESFREAVEQVGLAIDAGGVLIIVLGILLAAALGLLRGRSDAAGYASL